MGSRDQRTNIVVAGNVGIDGAQQRATSVQHPPERELTPAELDDEQADHLPDREAMSLIGGATLMPPSIGPEPTLDSGIS